MPIATRYPGTIVSVPSSGDYAWNSPENAAQEDGTVAEAVLPSSDGSGSSEVLRLTNFTGDDVPSGASVSSVKAKVLRRKDSPGTVEDLDVREYSSGPVGSNLAQAGNWPTSLTEQEYTLGEFLPAVLNSASYGVQIQAALTESGSGAIAAVDVVSLEITYAIVPPPPQPGTGGLNVGGAFFMFWMQQHQFG